MVTQTPFDNAFDFVMKQEGGYCNRAEDRGGPTNYGITRSTLANWRNNKDVTDKDVENLSIAEAKEIYWARFWRVNNLGRIPSKTALILFDYGVNVGPQNAIKLLQKVLNKHFAENLVIDGLMGIATETAVFTAPETCLHRKMLQSMQLVYATIATKDASQLVFLRGWLNRTFALWDAVVS